MYLKKILVSLCRHGKDCGKEAGEESEVDLSF